MNSIPTDKLAELIAKKHGVLSQLCEIGHRQSELAERGDVPDVLKLLAVKQQLIGALQNVEQQLGPFRGEDPEARQWRKPEDRARCARQAEDCNQLLSEIVYLEKQSEDKMVARRDLVANQLQQVHSAHQARGAYAASRAKNASSATSRPIESQQDPIQPGSLNLISES